MAKLSADKTYVTVERGDTLSEIAEKYAGGASNYKKLATINNIKNPNLIYIGQKIKLTSSGSGGGSSTSSTTMNKVKIEQFGELSSEDNTLFATWSWSKKSSDGKDHTEKYKVLWTYETGNGIWFGDTQEISIDKDAPELSKYSKYNIPAAARSVKFKVKPIAKTKKNKKDEDAGPYWTIGWSSVKTWTDKTPLETPSAPSIELDKNKYEVTTKLEGITSDAKKVRFQLAKMNSTYTKDIVAEIEEQVASAVFKVDAGGEYTVRCRLEDGSLVSEWSNYSGSKLTMPAVPNAPTICRANDETSIYLEWKAVDTATSYDIEYATKKDHFDITDQTQTKTGIETTKFVVGGLESGYEYFFRIRAVSNAGTSAWSQELVSTTVGTKPAAPTTWSSTTTATVGDPLILYWIHNTKDGSSQVSAELDMYVNGTKVVIPTIKNTTDEELKDKPSSYVVDTSEFSVGAKIEWRVKTCGVTKVYGDWSVQRTVNIYARPTLELTVTDMNGDPIESLTSFPAVIRALPGPAGQTPISYYLSIISNESYETIDNVGNVKMVSEGDAVYSKFFDIDEDLYVEISASNVDLENGVSYTVKCVVSMDSGLTVEESVILPVNWSDVTYEPDADITIDQDTFTAYIRPYCESGELNYYRVDYDNSQYICTDEMLGYIYGEATDYVTTTGERVYSGITDADVSVYFCQKEVRTLVDGVLLSVYRREYDGKFTEIATDIENTRSITVTDPHPALDFARYRIVVTTKDTGSVSYYDIPNYPVDGIAAIIQWDEQWTSFETSEDDSPEQPPWSGSLLKLPYNIDVSDSNSVDVEFIEFAGRSHPVTFYGTQLGTSSSWKMDVIKSDKETLYALRRLAIWTGDVYVREPSGSGYWANIGVSFSQTHNQLTIPVTLTIKRVEGGI